MQSHAMKHERYRKWRGIGQWLKVQGRQCNAWLAGRKHNNKYNNYIYPLYPAFVSINRIDIS